ncbi:MAG: hypothetical protein V3S32_02640 [Acidimicrobiia bacterium]
MTHRAAGSGRGVPRLWLLPMGVLTGMLAVTAMGILSQSLVLDLAAWWPVWLIVIVVALLARRWRVGRVRVAGLVPLLATAVLLALLAGHLQGWPAMPSSSSRLIGPAEGSPTASLTAQIVGVVRIASGGEFLYQVEPVRLGGEIGIPEAIEQVGESSISVILQPPSDPGFYAFVGWNIVLSPSPMWTLALQGEIDADLSALQVTELQLGGDGVVRLGLVSQLTPATISGEFQLIVPDGVAVRVVGTAVVPETWQQLSDGWKGPTPGDGWVISVPSGSSLSVTHE